MADLNAIGGSQSVEPLDLETYPDARDFVALPKKGRYTVQAPDSFPTSAFGRTKAGALSIQVDPTIVGPTSEGFKIRFTKVSAKQYKRGSLTASQLGDYLRACGVRGRFSSEQDQADAVEATANKSYQVDIDWRAYNTTTQFSLEGMDRFPTDGNGGHLPYCEDPADFERDETGEIVQKDGKPVHKRLRAQVVVSRYVPAV